MTFEGFESPNFTQTPNFFFDEILMQTGITLAEVKILGFMIRYTYGWHRQGNSLQFTFTELQSVVNLGREAVNKAIKKLLEKNYIQRKEMNGKYYYRLNIKDFADYPWDIEFNWKKAFRIEKERNAQFGNRTDSSSEIEPTAVRKSNRQQFGNRTDKNSETIDTTETDNSLNKILNKDINKDINKNTNLSEDIYNTNLPSKLKNLLNELVDRLVYHNINISEIENHFHANSQIINEYQYIEVIKFYLTNAKGKIKNYSALMDTGIKKYLEFKRQNEGEKTDNENRSIRKPIRKEKLPTWFNEQYFRQNLNLSQEEEHFDFEQEKRKMEERLQKYKRDK